MKICGSFCWRNIGITFVVCTSLFVMSDMSPSWPCMHDVMYSHRMFGFDKTIYIVINRRVFDARRCHGYKALSTDSTFLLLLLLLLGLSRRTQASLYVSPTFHARGPEIHEYSWITWWEWNFWLFPWRHPVILPLLLRLTIGSIPLLPLVWKSTCRRPSLDTFASGSPCFCFLFPHSQPLLCGSVDLPRCPPVHYVSCRSWSSCLSCVFPRVSPSQALSTSSWHCFVVYGLAYKILQLSFAHFQLSWCDDYLKNDHVLSWF